MKNNDFKPGQKVTLSIDRDELFAGDIAYVTKAYPDGYVDLSDKSPEYFPQDDCIPERTAHRVPISLIKNNN